jgi:hypothetical protein
MTEEYKKNLIDYATGNLQTTSPTTDEIIKEIIEANRSDWIGYIPTNYSNMHIEGYINPSENTSNIGVLYGGYIDNSNNVYGFIILTDINMKPIKYITSFSSGTSLRYIQHMEQREDGTFCFIDDEYFSYNYETNDIKTSQKRFVMVNNFTVPLNEEYILSLNKTYIFPSNLTNFYCQDIFKDINSSTYVFFGKNSEDYINFISIDLKINVGVENEWSSQKLIEREYIGGFVVFDTDGDYSSTVLLNQPSSLRNYLIIAKKQFNSSTYTETNSANFNYYICVDTKNMSNQCTFLNENIVYFVGNNQMRQVGPNSYDKYVGLYEYNLSTNTYNTLFEKKVTTSNTNKIYEAIYISKNYNNLYIEYNNNIDTTNNKANYSIQRWDNEWKPIYIGNYNFIYNQRALYVGNKFNLLQIIMFPTNTRAATWNLITIKEIYNSNQYNGEPYINENVFIPLYSNLYSNGSLIFSRNLYNISVQNNMTMSSVEIPNTYLNDTTITQNDLISETNEELINNTQQWTKNIYEVVDLNFLNTINVIDEDTGNQYIQSAIKLNNSTVNGGETNYQNTPCNKYRINYADDTTQIQNLNWNSIDDTHKNISLLIYVDKPILSIDLISNDETTIYLTLPLNVEEGKYYVLNQKLRIGE